MRTHLDDQASGLRARIARCQQHAGVVPVPLVYADFLLFRGVHVELPTGVLVWHWRARVVPATGWDLQARLHAVGNPTQFDPMQLQRWRVLFPEWRLVGRRLELLQIADIGCLWLKTGAELMPRLRILLEWLCRNRPDLPIILAGIGSSAAQRIQNWAQRRYPLRCLTVMQELAWERPPAEGFYRLLRYALVPRAATASREP